MYGAMIWPLYSANAQSVVNLLSGGIPSVRASVMARYLTFYSSSSVEVSVVANLAAADIRSMTGKTCST